LHKDTGLTNPATDDVLMRPPSPLEGSRILLGVTGGIAAYKAADLASMLVQIGASVTTLMTPAATGFVMR
jgi:phosphopantothenoylcysteine decarboxylase/phosphopantothenate--cysteine ligase